MNLKLKTCCIIIILCFSTSCDTAPPTHPISSQESLSTTNLTDERISLREVSYYFSFLDTLPQGLPPQIVKDDEISYRLAQTIRNYLFYGRNSLEDFDQQTNDGVLETAIYHTNPLNLNYSYGLDEGFVCEEYPNHKITKLVEELVHRGKDPCAIFYADDVRLTAIKLFGADITYEDTSSEFYEYFSEQDVYIQYGDLSGPWFLYPQITAYSKTDDGYTCEATLVWALDSTTPIEVNDIVLTKNNFYQVTSNSEKYSYTFTSQQDGTLVLTKLQTLQ